MEKRKRRSVIASALAVIACGSLVAGCKQPYQVEAEQESRAAWESSIFGGEGEDVGYSLLAPAGQGFYLAGWTHSYGAGGSDGLLIHTTLDGEARWQRTYGGARDDYWYSVQPASAGGLLLAGQTASSGAGGSDAWLLLTDAAGTPVLERTLGGPGDDFARAALQTSSGDIVFAGARRRGYPQGADLWLGKMDQGGTLVWQRTFGGANQEYATALLLDNRQELVVCGFTNSKGAGRGDLWLLKFDLQGNLLWEKTFGGPADDFGVSLTQAARGDFLVAGHTYSSGAGRADAWVLKFSRAGNLLWQKTFGGPSDEFATSIAAAGDDRFVLTGFTAAFDDEGADLFVMAIDATGRQRWTQRIAKPALDIGYAVQADPVGRFTVTGVTTRENGNRDLWLLRFK